MTLKFPSGHIPPRVFRHVVSKSPEVAFLFFDLKHTTPESGFYIKVLKAKLRLHFQVRF